MDPLHTTVAIAPLAAYLLLVGMLNLSRRPHLTTGTRDLYALGIAVSGFFVVGPLKLFMPEPAAIVFGPYIWLMLIAFYSLCLTLFVLIVRPRLVVYNVKIEQLRPLLASVIQRTGWDHQWAGESLALPQLGVQLQLEKFSLWRNVTLVATAADQSYGGWRRLETELSRELKSVQVGPNPIGLLMVTAATVGFVSSLVWLIVERREVAERVIDLLRL